MSAIGTKRTSLVAPHMSAFEGKADMLPHRKMSAYDADIGLDRHPVRVTNTAADPSLSSGGNAPGKATDIWRNAP